MPEEDEISIPAGAAVFPEIPAELGVHPLLLATVHGMIFLAGSEEAVVNPQAADEAVATMAHYLTRLSDDELVWVGHYRRVHRPMTAAQAVTEFHAAEDRQG